MECRESVPQVPLAEQEQIVKERVTEIEREGKEKRFVTVNINGRIGRIPAEDETFRDVVAWMPPNRSSRPSSARSWDCIKSLLYRFGGKAATASVSALIQPIRVDHLGS